MITSMDSLQEVWIHHGWILLKVFRAKAYPRISLRKRRISYDNLWRTISRRKRRNPSRLPLLLAGVMYQTVVLVR